MSKVVVKEKKVKGGKKLAAMFNQMLGNGDDINVAIVYPKYQKMREYMTLCTKTLSIFCKTALFQSSDDVIADLAVVQEFVTKCEAEIQKHFSFELPEVMIQLRQISSEDTKQFCTIYKDAKNCETLIQLVGTCNNLMRHKVALEGCDPNLFSRIKVPEFCPLTFAPKFDLKALYEWLITLPEDSGKDTCVRLIVNVLSKVFKFAYAIYGLITSPDFDVNEFVEQIINRLEDDKKNFRGCEKAFDRIRKSVHLLQDNFQDYYRDFVRSKNSTSIMESFVGDVSRTCETDRETVLQFKKIIVHYKKLTQSRIQDPRIRLILEQLDKSNERFEKYTNLSGSGEVDPEDDEKQPDLLANMRSSSVGTPGSILGMFDDNDGEDESEEE